MSNRKNRHAEVPARNTDDVESRDPELGRTDCPAGIESCVAECKAMNRRCVNKFSEADLTAIQIPPCGENLPCGFDGRLSESFIATNKVFAELLG